MKTFFIIALLAAALVSPSWARAQEQASEQETELLSAIAKCLIEGLPRDWQRAQMTVELEAPGAPGGAVRYLFSRTLSRDQLEPFTPCDERQPAAALADIRALQTPERSGWKTARFVLNRDGKFDLTYDYPKP
jgi:hypothetical protein